MYREIEAKRKEILEKRPLPEELIRWVEMANILDFAYTDLRLEGSTLTMEGVSNILKGGIVSGVSIREHEDVALHRRLLREFFSMNDMKEELDRHVLVRLYTFITGDKQPNCRSNSKVLYHLDHVVSGNKPILSQLDELFRKLYAKETAYNGDYILRAVELHDGIVAIYPFEERTEMLARTALQYEFIRNGLPIVPIMLSETEYNTMLTAAIKKNDHMPFYETICTSIEKKLDAILGFL
jgi:hypothetical protein